MNHFIRHISWVLLVVFGLIITPKELIHEWYGHDDTHCRAAGSLAVETHHSHCEILRVTSLVYTSPEKTTLDALSFIRAFIINAGIVAAILPIKLYFNLRAPPRS